MNKYKFLCLVSYSIELTRKKLVPESWEKQKTIGNAHNLKEIRVKLRLGNFHTLWNKLVKETSVKTYLCFSEMYAPYFKGGA